MLIKLVSIKLALAVIVFLSSTTFSTEQGVELSSFSFDSPFEEDDEEHWEIDQCTTVLNKQIVLVPAVSGRSGWLFSREKMLTTSFEVHLDFKVVGERKASDSQGFALWYLKEKPNPSTIVHGASFMGLTRSFNGLGVFFRPVDAAGQYMPSISAIVSDGSGIFDAKTALPSTMGDYVDYRNGEDISTFKLEVDSSGNIHGSLTTRQGVKDCFSFKDERAVFEGYLGFTAATGPSKFGIIGDLTDRLVEKRHGDPSKIYSREDMVAFTALETYNNDLTKPGQPNNSDLAYDAKKEKNDVLKEHLHPNRLANELHHFEKLLVRHIAEQRETAATLTRNVASVSLEIKRLREDLHKVKTENGEGAAVKSEIGSIKQMLHKHTQSHMKSMADLKTHVEQSTIPNYRTFTKQAQALEQTLSSHSSYHFIIGLLVISSMITIGLFIWKGFRDMEKRHLL